MRSTLFLLGIWTLFALNTNQTFGQNTNCTNNQSFTIVVLGSSTPAGFGPSVSDSVWVNRFRDYLQGINSSNTVVNLAIGGTTSYHIMPTGFSPSLPGRPSPNGIQNITRALTFQPDAIIINMPSDDVSRNYSAAEELANYDSIVAEAEAAGVPVWICTPQPKNWLSPSKLQRQIAVKDSVLAIYGDQGIDFWNLLAAPNGYIVSAYGSGDGFNLNNSGHWILFNRVKNAGILNKLCPDTATRPDYSVANVQALNYSSCGNSSLNWQVDVENLGIDDSMNVTINFKQVNLNNSTTILHSDTIVGGLNGLQSYSTAFNSIAMDPGTYEVEVWISGNNLDSNQVNDTVIQSFTVIGNPTITVTPDTVCAGDIAILEASATNASAINWYDQPTNGNLIHTGDSLVLNGLANNMTFYVEAANGSCTSSRLSVTAITKPSPQPNLGADTTIELGQNLILNPGIFIAYQWSDNSVLPQFSFNSNNYGLGSHAVAVTVYLSSGCSASDTINIFVSSPAPPPPPPPSTSCIDSTTFTFVVLGSSTPAGFGPSHPDSSWVNKYRKHLKSINTNNDVINLAIGGTTTYHIMPTGFSSSIGNRPSPNAIQNITRALTYNPDGVIINMPSDDISRGYLPSELMNNYDSIISYAASNGVPVWICTNQPKNWFSPLKLQRQFELKDSILNRYGDMAINFWDSLASPVGYIANTYNADGINLNDAGHEVLFNRVVDRSILASFCPGNTGLQNPDYALTRLSAANIETCGDSLVDWELVVKNLGVSDSSNIVVDMSFLHVPTNSLLSFSDTLFHGLDSLSMDTLNYAFTMLDSGNYELNASIQRISADSNQLNDSISIVERIFAIPSISTIDDTVCSGDQAILIASSQGVVQWYDQQVGGNLIQQGDSLILNSVTAPSVYFAQASNGQCSSDRIAANVSITPLPQVYLGNDTSLQLGDSLVLNAGSFTSYLWSTGANSASIKLFTSALGSGVHDIDVSVTNVNGCIGRDTITITVGSIPPPPPPPSNGNCVDSSAFTFVVLGSSTAAGTGPSSSDSAWVNRFRAFLQSINSSSNVINLAIGGTTTYHIMPDGFVSPIPGRPSPNSIQNVTRALTHNPDGIIVNMPSNDASRSFGVSEQMFNFDSIISTAAAVGVPVWICTPQPRNFNPTKVQIQLDVTDSVLSRYGAFAINFWDSLADVNGLIRPLVNSGDGIHLNNYGHRILFNRVKNIDLLSSPCPDSATVPDYRVKSIEAPSFNSCGDSNLLWNTVIENIGINDSNNVVVHFTSKYLPTGSTVQTTDTIFGGLSALTDTILSFHSNAVDTGDYEINVWINAVSADSNQSNDSATSAFSIIGRPKAMGLNDTVCSGEQARLIVESSNADGVNWFDQQVGGNLINSGDTFMVANVFAPVTYYAEGFNASCVSERIALSVIVNQLPMPNLGADSSIQLTDTILLHTGSFLSYSWSTSESSSSIVVRGNQVGTGIHNIDVTVTDSNGCSASDTVQITVGSPPPPPLVVDYELAGLDTLGFNDCGDSNQLWRVILSNSADNNTNDVVIHFGLENPAQNYTHYQSDTIYGGLLANHSDSSLFVSSTILGGSYTAKAWIEMVNNDINTNNDSLAWNFTLTGTPDLIVFHDTVCSGESASLSAISNTGDTLLWFNQANGGSAIHGGSNFLTPPLNSSTTYYVQSSFGPITSAGNDSIETTYNSNLNWNGTMFDVVGKQQIILDSIAIKVFTLGVQEVEIYQKSGSHIGHEGSASSWNLISTDTVNIVSQHQIAFVKMNNMIINANDTVGIYVKMKNHIGKLAYLRMTSPLIRSNNELEIIAGTGITHNYQGSFYPRAWNGGIFYHYGNQTSGTCPSALAPVNALINTSPAPNLGMDVSLTLNDSVDLFPGLFSSYTWSNSMVSNSIRVRGNQLGLGSHIFWVDVENSYACTGRDSIQINVTSGSSSRMKPKMGEISVYPNPNNGNFNIELKDLPSTGELNIFNQLGQVVFYRKFIDAENTSEILQIANLKEGHYFIKFVNEQITVNKQVIVKEY